MKRVLVTGGRGFIGQQTLTPLIESNFEVHIISSTDSPLPQKNIYLHQANLLNGDTHINLMNKIKPTHLLHSAWYTQHGKFWEAIENIAWLKATISLAEAFYASGGKRLLGVGTCAEYAWHSSVCVEGKTAEIPSTLYGKTKQSTFSCLSALARSLQKSFAWARIFFPYGEGEGKERLIPYVISNLLQNKKAECTHGNQIRDYLHVSDIGHALASLLDSEISGAVNVASGTSMTIRDIISRIAFILKREDLLQFGAIPEPAHSPAYLVASIDRLQTELKWAPRLSLNEGLLRTIAWWRQQKLY